jgi:hypothetical protein
MLVGSQDLDKSNRKMKRISRVV